MVISPWHLRNIRPDLALGAAHGGGAAVRREAMGVFKPGTPESYWRNHRKTIGKPWENHGKMVV